MIASLINKYKREIFTFIISFAAFLAVSRSGGAYFPVNGLSAAVIFTLIYFLMYRTDFSPKKEASFWCPFSLSCVFSIIKVLGDIIAGSKKSNITLSVTLKFFRPVSVILILGHILIFFALLSRLFEFLKVHKTVGEKRLNIKPCVFFFISWILILVCYLPYFISEYPAAMSVDSISSLLQLQGKIPLSNAHPVLYTGFLFIFYKLGYLLFSSGDAAIGTAAFAQMMLMSGIFAYTLTFMYKRQVKTILLFFSFCLWALFPLNAYYSVTLWKDVPFSGLMLLMVLAVIRLAEKFDTLRLRDLVPFTVISILTVLCRNNALYMMPLLFISAFIAFRGKRKLIAASFAVIFAVTTLITGPVFDLAGITRSSSCEYIAIPLQQIARIVCADGDMDEEDREMINRLIPIETIKEVYDPVLVDGIKQHPSYDMEYFDSHKAEFLKLWARLVIKNPATAMDAYFHLTYGYYYPLRAQTVHKGISYEGVSDLGIETTGPHFAVLDKLDAATYVLSPVNVLWMIGAWVWATAVFMTAMAMKKGWRSLIIAVPGAGILLTLLVATPINCENRYMYFAHAALPVMLCAVDMMPEFRAMIKHKEKDQQCAVVDKCIKGSEFDKTDIQ